MDIDEFIKNLEAEIEELPPGTLKPDTDYRKVAEWSSMHALIVIAFVDMNFNVTLNGADLRKAITVSDLYNIVQEKLKNV
ncbi:MAG TPA: acyl carrier protein [Bacteroidia bacterium]|jgi:acyl carrier protein|nr:acyl carrier protein [Bacteroidia bacterium]